MVLTGLMSGLFMQPLLLMPMCAFSLQFTKSDPKYVLKSQETDKEFRFVIQKPRLLIPKVILV